MKDYVFVMLVGLLILLTTFVTSHLPNQSLMLVCERLDDHRCLIHGTLSASGSDTVITFPVSSPSRIDDTNM